MKRILLLTLCVLMLFPRYGWPMESCEAFDLKNLPWDNYVYAYVEVQKVSCEHELPSEDENLCDSTFLVQKVWGEYPETGKELAVSHWSRNFSKYPDMDSFADIRAVLKTKTKALLVLEKNNAGKYQLVGPYHCTLLYPKAISSIYEAEKAIRKNFEVIENIKTKNMK